MSLDLDKDKMRVVVAIVLTMVSALSRAMAQDAALKGKGGLWL